MCLSPPYLRLYPVQHCRACRRERYDSMLPFSPQEIHDIIERCATVKIIALRGIVWIGVPENHAAKRTSHVQQPADITSSGIELCDWSHRAPSIMPNRARPLESRRLCGSEDRLDRKHIRPTGPHWRGTFMDTELHVNPDNSPLVECLYNARVLAPTVDDINLDAMRVDIVRLGDMLASRGRVDRKPIRSFSTRVAAPYTVTQFLAMLAQALELETLLLGSFCHRVSDSPGPRHIHMDDLPMLLKSLPAATARLRVLALNVVVEERAEAESFVADHWRCKAVQQLRELDLIFVLYAPLRTSDPTHETLLHSIPWLAIASALYRVTDPDCEIRLSCKVQNARGVNVGSFDEDVKWATVLGGVSDFTAFLRRWV